MKLSLDWLNSYFDIIPNWDEVFHKLTMAGIEVEQVELPIRCDGIIVAQVAAVNKHPNADKLKLCMVDVGKGELLQIVCGAGNVEAGIKVPCATIGATLPDGSYIDKREMRGVASCGMLCSGEEVGYSDGVDGLLVLPNDAPLGRDIWQYLGLSDKIVEFKIAPNRGDCLSVLGILREIVGITNYIIKSFPPLPFDFIPKHQDKATVRLDEAIGCSSYLTLIIRNINNRCKLPPKIIGRLHASGMRSVSPVVDIINYVMLELGQPMHAFDLENLGDKLNVRLAVDNESIKLLNGKEVFLSSDTLVICDSNDKPSAIAGLMGGCQSAVNHDSCNIILESAIFSPDLIVAKAKRYGISSEAAYRFERGVDCDILDVALKYAGSLIVKYCGGDIGDVAYHKTQDVETKKIELYFSEINQAIGVDIDPTVVATMLHKIGFETTVINEDGVKLCVDIPSYRLDILIKQDIIEEIARTFGYDNIPAQFPVSRYTLTNIDAKNHQMGILKSKLVHLGYSEIISYAFIEEKFEQLLGNCSVNAIRLQNPIANLSLMRTSLIADLIKALEYNLNHGHKSVRIFEVARVFHGEDEYSQPLRLSGLAFGSNCALHVNNDVDIDFYDIKSDIESLLYALGEVKFMPCNDNNIFHSGRCARVSIDGQEIGIIGQLHPKYSNKFDFSVMPYLFELDMDYITDRKPSIMLHQTSKFPKVERDIAFIMDRSVLLGEVMDKIRDTRISYLIGINIFDVYSGSNIEATKKSVTMHFVFQSSKTLVEEDVVNSVASIISVVEGNFLAKLRT